LWEKTVKADREINKKLSKQENELVTLLKEKVNPKTLKERVQEIEAKITQMGVAIQQEIGMSKEDWSSYKMSLEKSINWI
jgi:hypothetical protein